MCLVSCQTARDPFCVLSGVCCEAVDLPAHSSMAQNYVKYTRITTLKSSGCRKQTTPFIIMCRQPKSCAACSLTMSVVRVLTPTCPCSHRDVHLLLPGKPLQLTCSNVMVGGKGDFGSIAANIKEKRGPGYGSPFGNFVSLCDRATGVICVIW